MWPILLCSIAALTIAIERLITFYRADIDSERFLKEINRFIQVHKFSQAEKLCDENPSSIAQVVKAGIQMYGHPRAEILESMEETVTTEVAALQHYIPLLGSIAHTSLLLGLLGTVSGLIRYFQVIQLKATTLNPVAPGDLAGGIWEALLNTVFGLIVAIPAYAMYNYLAHRTNVHTTHLESAATQLSRSLTQEHVQTTNQNSFSKSPSPVPSHVL